MNPGRTLFALLLLFFAPLSAEKIELKGSKNQILYLIRVGEIQRGIELYQSYAHKTGAHNFTILEQIGHLLLTLGAQARDEETLLLTMYGLNCAGLLEGIDLYERGMESSNPKAQMVTMRFLSSLQDDRVESLLFKAFSSPFLAVRMEAAYILAKQRSNKVTGMLHSLMQKLPPPLRTHFPELFALIGTPDATGILKRMIGDPYLPIRLASILVAAKWGRDDFLDDIRAGATHTDPMEQEACAAALGFLNDSHSLPLLKELATSSRINVKLAACHSLAKLGATHFQQAIIASASQKELFAIPLLETIPHTEALLRSLLQSYDCHVRLNSALVLLKKRLPSCLPILLQLLTEEESNLGVKPISSAGQSLTAWKMVPSATQQSKKWGIDIPSITLAFREQILIEAAELPQEDFLTLAKKIFEKKVHTLIPCLVHLLENINTPETVALLREGSKQVGAPFIRTYCHLALYRLKNHSFHADCIHKWISKEEGHELFQFREILSWTDRIQQEEIGYSLTPKETSRLLIEGYETLAQSCDVEGINLLIQGISQGHEKNRYVLAGLLLKAIQ